MADRAFPVAPLPRSGVVATVVVAALCFGAMAVVALRGAGVSALEAGDWSALRFTLLQAALSAAFSVALAIPLARALARRQFFGRPVLILLMGAPFVLPVIVAVFGLIAIFGRNGLVSDVLELLGLPMVEIYGLHGVVLAHVFFNLPLATRLFLLGWQAVPGEHLRLAQLLRFGALDMARIIERPMLMQVVPGAMALVFLICTTSFAVALMLGGGPKATTVELAIYQAFRFEFDLTHAATLALLQFALGLVAASVAYLARGRMVAEQGLDTHIMVPAPPGAARLWMDRGILVLGSLFLIAPLLAVFWEGLAGLADLSPSVLSAIWRSLAVALAATVLVLLLALPMVALAIRGGRIGVMPEAVGFLLLSVSPLVIGTGLYLMIFPLADPVVLALPVTALVNAALALPFVMQVLIPHMRRVELAYGPLATQLGMAGWARWRWLLLPRMARPVGFAAGLSAALSVGDLGVIALFADPAHPTLPLYVYQLLGSYRTDAASGAALLLMVLSLFLFWAFDRGGRHVGA